MRGFFSKKDTSQFYNCEALTNLLLSHLKLLLLKALEYSGQRNISKNNFGIILGRSQDSSVGIATDCGQVGGGSLLSKAKLFCSP
jgi:hypothetical protein